MVVDNTYPVYQFDVFFKARDSSLVWLKAPNHYSSKALSLSLSLSFSWQADQHPPAEEWPEAEHAESVPPASAHLPPPMCTIKGNPKGGYSQARHLDTKLSKGHRGITHLYRKRDDLLPKKAERTRDSSLCLGDVHPAL